MKNKIDSENEEKLRDVAIQAVRIFYHRKDGSKIAIGLFECIGIVSGFMFTNKYTAIIGNIKEIEARWNEHGGDDQWIEISGSKWPNDTLKLFKIAIKAALCQRGKNQ